MSNKYSIDLLGQSSGSEKGVASNSRFSRRRPWGKASIVNDGPYPPRRRDGSNESGVGCRLCTTQTVIQMSNNRYRPTGSTQDGEHMQERQRIAAPRHCNQYPIGGLTNTLNKQELMQLVEHSTTR
jgi:hypothetical protein